MRKENMRTVTHTIDRQTDKRTNRQTDRQRAQKLKLQLDPEWMGYSQQLVDQAEVWPGNTTTTTEASSYCVDSQLRRD